MKLGQKSVFGHVRVRVTPSRRQVAPQMTDDPLDGTTRKLLARFLPAIRHGLLSEAERWPRAGRPLLDAEITGLGGAVTTESAKPASSMAAAGALREALARSEAVVLEPHMKFEVTAPEDSTGHIVHDLNRRGAISPTNGRARAPQSLAAHPLFQDPPQGQRQETHQDARFHPLGLAMKDRPQAQGALGAARRCFGLLPLQIAGPHLGRVLFRAVGAQQIGALRHNTN